VSRFGRYLLWQVPGWVVVAAGLAVLQWLAELPAWIVPAGVAAFMVKDLAMYRVVRDALLPPPDALVGARGRAVERLAPGGYVKIEGELWRAETSGGEIAAGADVIVREARGLTLRVEAPDALSASEPELPRSRPPAPPGLQ
jgi:membrane protein implicated in regulation of membrane protease activity